MVDSSKFIYINGKDMIILLVYMDDIIVTGNNSSQIQQLISHLDLCFALKDLGYLSYFLGLKVTKFGSHLHLC